jgi:hypothetical protein
MALSLKENEKLTIPATQEKILDKLWIRQIIIQTPSPLVEGSVKMEYGPWSGNMAEDAVWRDVDGNDITKFISINNLYSTMIECPELKFAFDAILSAILPLQAFLDAKESEVEESEVV